MQNPEGASGQCLCGAVQFRVAALAGPAAYCHCTDCRKCTGSAFNISVPVRIADLTIVAGTPAKFEKLADSGNPLMRHFCDNCGSPLFTSSPAHQDLVYIKAGSLDDPELVKPAYQSWTQSAVCWGKIPAGLPSYAKARLERKR